MLGYVLLIGVPEPRIGESAHGPQHPPTMHAITYGKAPVRINRIRRPDEQSDILNQRLAVVCPFRQEPFFHTVLLGHENLASKNLRILDLADWLAGPVGRGRG